MAFVLFEGLELHAQVALPSKAESGPLASKPAVGRTRRPHGHRTETASRPILLARAARR